MEEVDSNNGEEVLGSSLTMEKVAAAKQFIENHYKNQMKSIQERKQRRWVLERKLASSDVPKEEQINLIKDLERKETEFMRLRRNKICVDDFELLTIIGRGAFGEVRLCREKKSGNIYAMKKLKKSEMVSRGQVDIRKIVHWKNHLRFPEDSTLSSEAKDLICRLLCDVENRLGTRGAAEIKAHPWFMDIEWDKLYEMDAAFKPEVNGELDTQNFMKFDEMDPATSARPPIPARPGSGPSRKMHLTPKDLSFVGYTYKNFDAVKALRNSSDHTRSTSPSRPSIDTIFGDSTGNQGRKESAEETDIRMMTSMEDVVMSP